MNNQQIRFNLDTATKHQKKELMKYCEFVYAQNYRSMFDWLPESILNVSSQNVESLATIEGLTGVRLVQQFLQLRKSAIEIKKRIC